jgi:HAD superfamily hydrolase (TIGR01484 family)
MKYKALFLDVDGTIVPYKEPHSILPSEKVRHAIQRASEKIAICLATGRPFFMLEYLLNHLNLKQGLAVINDGAQVIDIQSRQALYQKAMLQEDVRLVSNFFQKQGIVFFLNDGSRDTLSKPFSAKRRIFNIFTMQKMEERQVDMLIKKLSYIATTKASKTHDGATGKYELLISHAEATKLHGMIVVSKILKVKREETIGIGDSGNDFPLLMASGLKVAMGNAIKDLKAIADYIAPSVEEDGVADVIEKFVLQQ